MKKIKLNGKEITPKPLTFNTICDLEDRGFDMSDLGNHMLSTIRIFVSLWAKCSAEEAGDMIEGHISNGGDLGELTDAITEAMNESGFFNRGKKSPKKELKMTEA